MSNKFLVTAMSAVVLLTQTACMTKDASVKCTVTGAKYLSAGASPDQICRDFKARLAQSMADEGAPSGVQGLTIALELHKRGSAEARITRQSAEGPTTYPVTAVDVMDKQFSQGDLDKLADAVARQLMDK